MTDDNSNNKNTVNQNTNNISSSPQTAGIQKEREVSSSPLSSELSSEKFQVPKEVKEYVKDAPVSPQVPEDVAHIISVSPHDQKTETIEVNNHLSVKTPLNDNAIIEGLKKSPFDSVRWLTEYCIKLLKKAHVHLKKVNGRYIRVPSTVS